MSVNENEPVKCKDCSIWWRGLEHRCPASKDDLNDAAKKLGELAREKHKLKEKQGCPQCGAKGVHHCTGPKRNYDYTCHWCGKIVDYRYSHNCGSSKERY
jgi:transposase-like protein